MLPSVDYSSRFAVTDGQEPWIIDRALIDNFGFLYAKLKEEGDVQKGELIDALNEVFFALNCQVGDDFERYFLAEMFNDLRSMASCHVDFYTVRAKRGTPGRGRASQLHHEGFFITKISGAVLDDIRYAVAPVLDALRAKAHMGKVDRTDLSVNSGRVVRRIVRSLNREFAANGVLSDVGALLLRRTRVVGAAIELSVSGSSWWKPNSESNDWPKTLYAHVDREVDAPKSIVYLTDVGPMNGPTSCYPGAYQQMDKNPLQDLIGRSLETIGSSPDSPLRAYYAMSGHPLQNERFRGHFMRLPADLRFNSHFGWDVMPRSRLEDSLVSSEFQILGPAGTALVFNGAELLHRGGLVEEGERVVLQVVFGDPTLRQRAAQVFRFATKILHRH